MADSTMLDVSKMKVVELRKELKSRGLSHTGDKTELVTRLQAAIAQDEHGDINLDSDEIDSDGVLEDEDDKSQNDILDDPGVDTLNEELALADHVSPAKSGDNKPTRTLKRKITTDSKNQEDSKDKEVTKKIVLNRSTSITTTQTNIHDNKDEVITPEKNDIQESNKIKITADIDTKTRLELRAKRFGLPIKMTEAERKEARRQRFGQASNTVVASNNTSLSGNIEKLKKRAERFGQNVSKIMTDIENKEKLEKRKAKFGQLAK